MYMPTIVTGYNTSPDAVLAEQRNAVYQGWLRVKKPGDDWCLIGLPWYQLWSHYVGLDGSAPLGNESSYPGPIDNSSIVDQNGQLLHSLNEQYFMAVPVDVWNYLASYYKISGKAPHPIVRTVICDSTGNNVIELYPFNVVVCNVNDDNALTITRQTLSRVTTIEQLAEKQHGRPWLGVLTANVKQKFLHFWLKRKDSNKFELQNGKSTRNLEQLGITDGCVLVLKRSTEGLPPNLNGVKNIFEALGASVEVVNQMSPQITPKRPESPAQSQLVKKSASKPGLCGLDNLGSTCFINSVIQCLGRVAELREYFTSGNYKTAIDRDAKRGELADAYAALMRSMWSGLNETAMPRDFREAFLKHAAHFGEGQQDAHNFLQYLLVVLQEELSKTSKRKLEETSLPLEKPAKDYWLWYKDRQRSLVSDLFDGLLKSTLRCEVCNETVTSFEPFSCLSLPIPSYREIPVYFRFIDSKKQVVVIYLWIPRRCKVAKVRSIVATAYGVQPENFVIGGMTMDFRFTKWYDNSEVPPFGDREMAICFETNKPATPENVRVVVYLGSGRDTLHGIPFLLLVSRESTTEMGLNQMVYQLVEPLFAYDRDIPFEGHHYSLMLANTDLSGEQQQLRGTANYVFRNELARAKTKCLVMLWDSRVFNHFFQQSSFEADFRKTKPNFSDSTDLSECFDDFLEEELLSGADAWRCPKCDNQPRPAYKKMDLNLLPPYFIIHLNRFHEDDFGYNKLSTFVQYPVENLDMAKYAPQLPTGCSPFYNLVAAVNHYGDINGGHYKAIALGSESKKWHAFDDRYVSDLAPDKVVTDAAFLLIYQRAYSNSHRQTLI